MKRIYFISVLFIIFSCKPQDPVDLNTQNPVERLSFYTTDISQKNKSIYFSVYDNKIIALKENNTQDILHIKNGFLGIQKIGGQFIAITSLFYGKGCVHIEKTDIIGTKSDTTKVFLSFISSWEDRCGLEYDKNSLMIYNLFPVIEPKTYNLTLVEHWKPHYKEPQVNTYVLLLNKDKSIYQQKGMKKPILFLTSKQTVSLEGNVFKYRDSERNLLLNNFR